MIKKFICFMLALAIFGMFSIVAPAASPPTRGDKLIVLKDRPATDSVFTAEAAETIDTAIAQVHLSGGAPSFTNTSNLQTLPGFASVHFVRRE